MTQKSSAGRGAPAAVRPVMKVSLDLTRTSVSCRFSAMDPLGSPPAVDMLIGGEHFRRYTPQLIDDPSSPLWSINAQWLQPLPQEAAVELRFAANGFRFAGATVNARDGKHAMYSRASRYAMFYNPKSACTSVRNLFFFLHTGELGPEAADFSIRHAPQFFPLPVDGAPEFKINVVRDPYRRLVSGFVDKVASQFFAPHLCAGHAIYQWRFGAGQEQWGQLTFMDYLAYLAEHRETADIHFQPQPLVTGDVELVRVEDLERQLCDVYARRRPELLERVREFFTTPSARANESPVGRAKVQIKLDAPHLLPVSDLAAIVSAGNGFNAQDFISDATLPAMNVMLAGELAALGYAVRSSTALSQ